MLEVEREIKIEGFEAKREQMRGIEIKKRETERDKSRADKQQERDRRRRS